MHFQATISPKRYATFITHETFNFAENFLNLKSTDLNFIPLQMYTILSQHECKINDFEEKKSEITN